MLAQPHLGVSGKLNRNEKGPEQVGAQTQLRLTSCPSATSFLPVASQPGELPAAA